jgi:hypothetical protein
MRANRSRAAARIFRLLAAAAILVLLRSSSPAQTKGQGLVAGGKAPDLIMLYTGDVIGHVDPCG